MAWRRDRSTRRDDGAAEAALLARTGSGERMLAMARTAPAGTAPARSGAIVGGTDRALYLLDDVVLPWHEIDQARWDQDASRLDVVTLPVDGPARAYEVHLVEPGRLPELVRERVTSSIVVNQHVALDGRRGARVVGRRLPDSPELDWVVVYDPGLDADQPEVRERLHEAVQRLRADLGV